MTQKASEPVAGIVVFDQKLLEEREYWINALSAKATPTSLRPDYPRPSVHTSKLSSIEIQIGGDNYQRLAKLTSNGEFLTYATLMAALKVCLYKYTGSHLIAVGSPA